MSGLYISRCCMNKQFIDKVKEESDLLVDWFCQRGAITFNDLHYATSCIWSRYKVPGSYLLDYMMRDRDKKFLLRHDELIIVPRGTDTPHIIPDGLRDLDFSKRHNMLEEGQWFLPTFCLGDWNEVLIKSVVWSDGIDHTYPLIVYYGGLMHYKEVNRKDNGLISFPVVYDCDGQFVVGVKHTSTHLFGVLVQTLINNYGSLDSQNYLKDHRPHYGLQRNLDTGIWVPSELKESDLSRWEEEVDIRYDGFINYADELRGQMSKYGRGPLQSLMYLLVSQKMDRDMLLRVLFNDHGEILKQ